MNNTFNYNRGKDNIYQNQQNQQLEKQRLKQLESQTYSNRTLARLIATSEIYALSLGYKNPQLYKKFDQFNNLKRKNKDELEGELILQIECCKVSMDSYINKYNNYDFPDDFDKEKTILELENIKKQVTNRDKKYYKAIIQLVQGNTKIPSFEKNLDDLENDEASERGDIKDPRSQLKMDIPIMKYVDNIKNQVKKKFSENPSYKVRLELDKPFETNEYFENLVKVQKEIDFKKENLKGSKKTSINREEHKLSEYY